MGAVKDVYLGLQGYDHWKTTEPEWDCFDEEPITPEQEKLLAEEQERDMAEIDAERAREERRRVLEEAAQVADAESNRARAGRKWARMIVARGIAGDIRALIDKEPSRG